MYYTKWKRNRHGRCNLCGCVTDLSWDHVPPKGCTEISNTEMRSIFDLLTVNHSEIKPKESQDGMKYRTLCKTCNSEIGSKYERTLIDFTKSVKKTLSSNLVLPKILNFDVQPQRLMKCVIGHIIAAKIEDEETEFDKLAREYVLKESASLPENIHFSYWLYPYCSSTVTREFFIVTPLDSRKVDTIYCQTMKFFPVAYICTDRQGFAGLSSLSQYRNAPLDEFVSIQLDISKLRDEHWPEAPNDRENYFFVGGKSVQNSIHANPRKR